MNDCKTCAHALPLYQRNRADRFSDSYTPAGYVRCAGPRYKGRSYFCRDNKPGCVDYLKKARGE